MGKEVQRNADLKSIIRQILPQKRIYYYKFMHRDNVELLAHEEECADSARELTACLLEIRGDYTSKCVITKKRASQRERGKR